MPKKRNDDQEHAHGLLEEWASGLKEAQGFGYPSAPFSPTVQGSRPELSAPEQYSHYLRRWATIDHAVARVGQYSHRLGMLLRWHYVDRQDENWCATKEGVSLTRWRTLRDKARKRFLEFYKQRHRGKTTGAEISRRERLNRG